MQRNRILFTFGYVPTTAICFFSVMKQAKCQVLQIFTISQALRQAFANALRLDAQSSLPWDTAQCFDKWHLGNNNPTIVRPMQLNNDPCGFTRIQALKTILP